jgi:hypothetical protein
VQQIVDRHLLFAVLEKAGEDALRVAAHQDETPL